MDLRPATADDAAAIATLVVGEIDQPSTTAAMRLVGIETLDDALELNRVMIGSTGSWTSTTLAVDDEPIGMAQVGEASMAFTPEIVELAHRLYGAGFQAFLGPRLEAQARVQATYPEDCLRISEIHVAPRRRGEGVGGRLLESAVEAARNAGHTSIGLQTLTTNPARHAFEAWGFQVADTTADVEFEQLSGAPGFHLMLRAI